MHPVLIDTVRRVYLKNLEMEEWRKEHGLSQTEADETLRNAVKNNDGSVMEWTGELRELFPSFVFCLDGGSDRSGYVVVINVSYLYRPRCVHGRDDDISQGPAWYGMAIVEGHEGAAEVPRDRRSSCNRRVFLFPCMSPITGSWCSLT